MRRSGGLPTHVENVRPLLHKTQSQRHGGSNVRAQTVARERIERDVDHTHDVGALAPAELAPSYYGVRRLLHRPVPSTFYVGMVTGGGRNRPRPTFRTNNTPSNDGTLLIAHPAGEPPDVVAALAFW